MDIRHSYRERASDRNNYDAAELVSSKSTAACTILQKRTHNKYVSDWIMIQLHLQHSVSEVVSRIGYLFQPHNKQKLLASD
jgi:hypothetical protein